MQLKKQQIDIDAPRELCFEVVAAAGRRLEKRSESEWIVEFLTDVGKGKIRTLELLSLDPPRNIRYRWLEGPIPDVEETMTFIALDGSRTRIVYEGVFSLGRGPVNRLIERVRIKPLFDRLVLEHLEQAKVACELRAARTKVHARKGTTDV